MTSRSWLRRLFARTPRTVRKAPARFRPRLEALEDRLAPAATASVSVTSPINEGDPLNLNGTATAATNAKITSISFDLNGDGVFGDAGGPVAPASTATSNPSLTFDTLKALGIGHPGTYPIAMQVTSDNNTTTTVYTTLVINRTPPTLTLTDDGAPNRGEPYTLTCRAAYKGDEQVSQWSINWGDGTIVTVPGPMTVLDHYYTTTGSETISVSVTDANGTFGPPTGVINGTKDVTVTEVDPALSVTAGSNQMVNEGAKVNLTGAVFSDPGAPDNYTATVDWGDSSPIDTNPTVNAPASPADFGKVSDSHVYGQAGTYTVTVAVKEGDLPAVSNTFKVTVTNLAPTVNAGANIAAGIGVPVHVHATFSDPGFPVGGAQETYTATIDWGDGRNSPGTVTVTPGSPGVPTTGTVTGTHQYSGDGPYTVTVTVSDGSGSGSGKVRQVTLSPATLPNARYGSAYQGQAFTATEAVDRGPFTFAVTSGKLPPGLSLTRDGKLSGTPSAANTYAFTVTATDSDGVTASRGYTLTVSPAPLSATGLKFHALAGTPSAGPVATFHNADPFGGASSYVAVIYWGDGTSSYGVISGSGATLTVSGTHTYTGPLTAPVYVQIRHKLGYTTVATAVGMVTARRSPR
jgi:hypothetical protein